ncbi:hypothetical protein [Spirosoma sp.]
MAYKPESEPEMGVLLSLVFMAGCIVACVAGCIWLAVKYLF